MSIAINGSKEAEEPDDYLIELMGMKADFPQEAMDAYGKIYFRYWDVMLYIAKGVTKDEDTAQDLLSDTFNMVYNKASTFTKTKVKDPDNMRYCIQKWMTAIMQNVFYDNYLDEAYKKPSDNENSEDSFLIDKRSIKKHLDDEYNTFIKELDEIEDSVQFEYEGADSRNLKLVKEYISKLSDRDRDIVLTFYNYYLPGKKTPSEVLNELEKKWNTTRPNIRKILEKFRKAIKESLQPHLLIRKERQS